MLCFRAFEYQEQSYQTQIDEFKAEKMARIQSMADKIIEGKRKKLKQEERKNDDKEEPEPTTIDEELIINQEIISNR